MPQRAIGAFSFPLAARASATLSRIPVAGSLATTRRRSRRAGESGWIAKPALEQGRRNTPRRSLSPDWSACARGTIRRSTSGVSARRSPAPWPGSTARIGRRRKAGVGPTPGPTVPVTHDQAPGLESGALRSPVPLASGRSLWGTAPRSLPRTRGAGPPWTPPQRLTGGGPSYVAHGRSRQRGHPMGITPLGSCRPPWLMLARSPTTGATGPAVSARRNQTAQGSLSRRNICRPHEPAPRSQGNARALGQTQERAPTSTPRMGRRASPSACQERSGQKWRLAPPRSGRQRSERQQSAKGIWPALRHRPPPGWRDAGRRRSRRHNTTPGDPIHGRVVMRPNPRRSQVSHPHHPRRRHDDPTGNRVHGPSPERRPVPAPRAPPGLGDATTPTPLSGPHPANPPPFHVKRRRSRTHWARDRH